MGVTQRSGAGWREVIRVDNGAWPRSEWSFDRAKVYLSEVNEPSTHVLIML